MSVMFEVLYKSPCDPNRESAISERVSRFGGRLTFRESSRNVECGPVCLTFEFDELQQADQAASQLRSHGEHVEGPATYGD